MVYRSFLDAKITLENALVVVLPVLVLALLVIEILLPLFKELETVEAMLGRFKHIFCVLTPLHLLRPGCLVAEV